MARDLNPPRDPEIFRDKVLVITGGTGTFGNAVLDRFLETSVREIRVFSRDEKKQEDLRLSRRSPKLKFYIGDVRQYDSIESALVGADFVFHAAALKQVPSCEFYPLEALRTNALGAENVLRAAVKCRVKRAIVLSTDKAVYPINAMGLSKALMEKLMLAGARVAKQTGTVLCGTRYGNVMASRGSVIPLFIEQIKKGTPLTVTDPNMTRFMMSIDDAVDLVLVAYEHAEPGDIFVHKAPAATIGTLAQALERMFGVDNPVQEIGTRHGEKLYETLLTREEWSKAEDCGKYFRVAPDDRDLNYAAFFTEGREVVSELEDYNSHNTERLDVEGLIDVLSKLEYVKRELASFTGKAAGAQGP